MYWKDDEQVEIKITRNDNYICGTKNRLIRFT